MTQMRFKSLRTFRWLMIAGWSVFVVMVIGFIIWQTDRNTLALAKAQAVAAFEKDVLYRRWNAIQGGVYVPATEKTPPNPYLEVPEREVLTPTNRTLTLINPAYMTRLVHELGYARSGTLGHITSLDPIRPENICDAWERKALTQFEKGTPEVYSQETIDGIAYLRFMRPLMTEKGCLKCHAQQGYTVGSVRGGISISIPMDPLWDITRTHKAVLVSIALVFGVIGFAGIMWATGQINLRMREREVAARHAEKLAREAEKANRAKGEFLANMSHEIRTPMNGVIGMTSLLLDTDLDHQQKDYARTVESSAEALLTTINDILDFSKIEAGKLDFEHIDFDLRSTLEDVAGMLNFKAEEKGLAFSCFIDPEVPPLLKGDPSRLRQVLLNLGTNAIKFTSRGEVNIHARMFGEDVEAAQIHIAVEDTGIGIPAKAQDRLFQSFSQVDSSTTRKYGGTGLGLAICRQLVKLMGGDIGVQSREGAGSTFYFTVSLEKQPPNDGHTPTPLPTGIKGKRILAVGGHKKSGKILRDYLQAWQCQVTLAAEGNEALGHLIRAAEMGQPFDLVISDNNMADMDGEALGQNIKIHSKLKSIPIILLMSQAMQADASRTTTSGFSACLTKPVRQSELLRTVLAVFENPSPGAPGEDAEAHVNRHTAAEKENHGICILVAEDNIINQNVALHMLEKLGFCVKAVDDGRQAVETLDREAFQMVLMDIQMPGMDGLEATRRIRQAPKAYRNIPIVAMTANAMKGDRERCLEAGMDDYLPKPIDADELYAKVKKYARRPEASP